MPSKRVPAFARHVQEAAMMNGRTVMIALVGIAVAGALARPVAQQAAPDRPS